MQIEPDGSKQIPRSDPNILTTTLGRWDRALRGPDDPGPPRDRPSIPEAELAPLTALLGDLREANDPDAARSELWSRAYEEIHQIARRKFRDERVNHTLQATALVGEAYLRLASVTFENRAHFFHSVARAMFQILVEHARHKQSLAAGGAHRRVEFDLHFPGYCAEVAPLELQDALERLEARSERSARTAMLHGVLGLTIEEVAEILGVSRRTAAEDWKQAKLHLRAVFGRDVTRAAVSPTEG